MYVVRRITTDAQGRVDTVEWQQWGAVDEPTLATVSEVITRIKESKVRALVLGADGAPLLGPYLSYFEEEDGRQWPCAAASAGGWLLTDLPRFVPADDTD